MPVSGRFDGLREKVARGLHMRHMEASTVWYGPMPGVGEGRFFPIAPNDVLLGVVIGSTSRPQVERGGTLE